MKTWTDAEVEVLMENYNRVSNIELCALLPCKTKTAIYKKAYAMGLRKAKEIERLNRSIANSGEKCNFWNGGIMQTSDGYRLVLMPSHQRANCNGYVMEHILVFENATGIRVPKNCCIHHLNGIKNDNRVENLCMMEFSAHTIHHHVGTKRSAETKRRISERAKKRYE